MSGERNNVISIALTIVGVAFLVFVLIAYKPKG